jgi:hypothetical protein
MSEPDYHMPAGLGVIHWQGRIVVYQMAGDQVLWARPLGDACIDISPELLAAIRADRLRSSHQLQQD